MPNKKLSSFTDEITTLNSTDRFLVARAGSSLDHFVTAQNLVPGYKGTSTTSRAIASSGSITVSTQSGLAYVVGSRVRLASIASPANYMEGVVTSYSSTTLVFTSDLAGGSGTIASWNLSLAGDRGAAGATGAGYGGTSTTSRTIASSGSISVTTQAGLAYVVGSRIRLASSATPANYMEGVITSYSSTTLVFTSDLAGGSGTIASWTLSLASSSSTAFTEISTSPLNSRTPAFLGEIVIQSRTSLSSRTMWRASTTASSGWVVVSGTPLISSSSGSPDNSVTADYQGQLYYALVSGGYGAVTVTAYVAGTTGGNRWAVL